MKTDRRSNLGWSWRKGIGGALLCAGLGLALLELRAGERLVYLGYDLLFLFRNSRPPADATVVYLDDDSFQHYQQLSTANWDRNLHARLLDRLAKDGCRAVVFDVVFSEPGSPEANANLTRAIRLNGKVVLAAALPPRSRAQISVKQPLKPLPEFQDAAAGWGIAEVDTGPGPDRVTRRYFTGHEHQPSLPWAAAVVAGAAITRRPGTTPPEWWLNYYGPAITLPHRSFREALGEPPGFFRGQVVFVGARPTTLRARDEADQFATPYTLWKGEFSPGVEIGATAFLNLLREDGLARLTEGREQLLVLTVGLVCGAALSGLRPLAAGACGVAGSLLLLSAALSLARQHVWFAWTVPALAQIPLAIAWSLGCHVRRLKFQTAVLEGILEETERRAEQAPAAGKSQGGFAIPDHTLVRRVGKGAYGEVWLARNAIGAFHAVKIVQRREFPSDTPYEREFRGMQKFMPISRSHPGFVHVLHVGRNDAEGFFFYIMEACDDDASGPVIVEERYVPRTLATMLERRGKLAPPECLHLGLDLALALDHLHAQQLVHRDIKPANIIYVNGVPKFADVGLVTDLAEPGHPASAVGTEGYIPPEGPGTAAADVYALGALREAATDRKH